MTRRDSPIVDADVAALISSGVAVIAATCDAALKPELTRGWGPVVASDGRSVSLCLNVHPGSVMRANLESTGALAVTFALPTTYRSVQVKGIVSVVAEPTAEALARVEAHAEAFVAECARVGLPPGFARSLLLPDLVAVELAVREIYDQTPGVGAGARI